MQHILIVDDDERINILLYRILTREGFIVSTAYSALQAEERAAYFSFDAIITDVKMPEKSGYDFVDNIRNHLTQFDVLIPIMMISAGLEKEQRIKGILKGADDYLVKPFEIDELIIRLRSLLKRAQAPSYKVIKEIKEAKEDSIVINDYTLEKNNSIIKYFDQHVQISHNEGELLAYLMLHPQTTFTRHELTSRFLTDQNNTPNSRALDVMIARLRRKLSAFNDPKGCPLITKRNEGYMWQI